VREEHDCAFQTEEESPSLFCRDCFEKHKQNGRAACEFANSRDKNRLYWFGIRMESNGINERAGKPAERQRSFVLRIIRN